MQELKRKYLRYAFYLFATLTVLMIIGSFLDLPISRLLYPGHESSLGQFFTAFGELPAFMAISCAGVLLVVRRGTANKLWSALIGFGGGALVLAANVLCIHEAVDSVSVLPVGVAILVSLFCSVVTGAGVLYLSRKASNKTVLRFALTLAFVAIGTMFLINVIKIPWGRVRMRLIVQSGNETYFTPWWQAGSAIKDKLIADGISKDEFRSFPSGHTGCAACAMLLLLLPTVYPRGYKHSHWFFIGGCAWTLAVAIARISMGAHFLTDVTMSCIIMGAVGVVGVWLFYFNPKFFNLIWRLITTSDGGVFASEDSYEG